jgi:hypothetical protein
MSRFVVSYSLGLFLTGIIYLSIFIPFILIAGWSKNISFFDVILFNFLPADQDIFSIGKAERTLFLQSLAVLYGAVAIVGSFLLPAANLVPFLIMATGSFIGFYMTAVIDILVFGHISWMELFGGAFRFKFFYVLMLYYLSKFGTEIARRLNIYPEKYEELFSGLYGLAAGWVLARGFGGAAFVFNGAIFLVITFFAMWGAELFIRWQLSFLEHITGADLRRMYRRISLFDPRRHLIHLRSPDRETITMILLMFFVNASFPVFMYFVALKWLL